MGGERRGGDKEARCVQARDVLVVFSEIGLSGWLFAGGRGKRKRRKK